MKKDPVRILHLDDSQLDAELVALTLEMAKDQLPASVKYVRNREEFLAALDCGEYDIILSDYRMPAFDGEQALKVAREKCPGTPFIMVTGELGEERVIQTLHRGATDYVLKDRMFRLVPAIQRALAEAENQKRRREAEEERERLLAEVQKSRSELLATFQAMHGGVMVFGMDGAVVLVNEAQARLLGMPRTEELKRDLAHLSTILELLDDEGAVLPLERWPASRVLRGESVINEELCARRKGSAREWHFSFSGEPVRDEHGEQILSVVIMRDITKQKRIEEELRRSGQRLRATFEKVPLGIAEVTAEGRFTEVNQRLRQMLGYAREEIIGRSISELTYEEDRDLSDRMNAALQQPDKDFVSYEKRYVRKDGTPIWVNVTVSALRDQKGQFTGSLGTIEDITERRRSVIEAQKAQQQKIEILESIQDAFYATDQELRITYVNRHAERALGLRREDLLGRFLWDVFPAAVGSSSYESIMRAFRERVPVTYEAVSPVLRTWLEVHVYPTLEGGVSITFRDIAERKQAETALRDSEERFSAAFEASPLPQAISRVEDGVFLNVNDAYVDFIGMPRQDLLGRSSADLGLLVDRDERRRLVELLARNGKVEGFEMRIQSRSRGERLVRVSASQFRSGEERTMLTISNDVTELRRAERALQESEQQFHSLADNIPQLAWMADPTGSIFWYNHRWYDYTGSTPQEMLGWGWQKVHHPEHVKRVADRFRAAVEHGELWEDTFPIRSREGEYRWFLSRAFPIRNAEGTIIRWFGTNTDITEQLRAAEDSHRQRQLLSAVIEYAPVGIGILQGPDHRYIIDNPAFAPFVEGKGPVVGRTVREVFPEVASTIVPLLDEVYRTGKPYHAENVPFQLRRHGRLEETYFTFIYAPWYNEQGGVEGVMSIAHETTSEVKRNRELEAERMKWQKIIEGIVDEVWACDAKGRMSIVNLATRDALRLAESRGRSLDEVLQGMEIFRPDGSLRPPEESPLLRSLKGEVVKGEEILRDTHTGEVRFRQYSAAPVRDAEGTVTGAVAVVRDVTDARKAEMEIRSLNEDLEERVRRRTAALERANRELESFSYSVSHDLKAPLRVIDGLARLLTDPREELTPEKRQQYLRLIHASTEQMTKLIEGFLAFARVSRQVPKKVALNMRTLAEQALWEQRQAAGEESARVQVTIGEMPEQANGDPVLLKQVFANLLANAFKFTRKKAEPRIEIGGYREDGDLVYFVRDNGAGFPSDRAEKLFQVFQRLHPQDEFEGTGIGLANVRRIVERHGGEVSAEGDVGKGATFFFALPIEEG